MEKKFCCNNPECKSQGDEKGTYVMTLSQESVMDEQNLAQIFCPRCKSRLVDCEDVSRPVC